MSYKLAINGYGRIGRCVLRALYENGFRDQLEIVAINEPADNKTIAHLTQYDSTHGRFQGSVALTDSKLKINDDEINLFHQESLTDLPWQNIDAVLECSGSFTSRELAQQHIDNGARKVIFSQPAESDVDATIVYGINHSELKPEQTIISNASCTTNCIAPVLKVINDELGIDCGTITTIHSAMNDQPVIDAYHHTDLRKTRSAGQSIIPVDTELAIGIERILPELSGRFSAQALRVPTVNVSAMDITLTVNQDTSTEAVNKILKTAADNRLHNILGYTEEPLASCDFNHDPHSGIVDASQTRVSGKRLVKVLVWFDNEWGYANRMLDTTLAWLNT